MRSPEFPVAGLPDLGVAQPVARLGADIRVNDPAAKDALPGEPGFLHDTRRCEVFNIAAGTDAPDAVLAHCPERYLRQRFGH